MVNLEAEFRRLSVTVKIYIYHRREYTCRVKILPSWETRGILPRLLWRDWPRDGAWVRALTLPCRTDGPNLKLVFI